MNQNLAAIEDIAPQPSRARSALLRRLIDIVALPSSNLPPQDRSMASDILLELLFDAEPAELQLCARRLADKVEAPRRLLRFLAASPIDIARSLLEDNSGIEESDLAHVACVATTEHRRCIARRKGIGAMLSDVLIDFAETAVLADLLNNPASRISDLGLDAILTLSRDNTELCPLLLKRPELTPAHAMAMFWWSDPQSRLVILNKHAAERLELIERCSDVFAIMAEEGWSDAQARKALQLIERRQRNRAAIDKSEFVNLEHAVETASKSGMTSLLAQEIGHLSGVKPITVAKIMSDRGGEGIAVMAKATGLKPAYLKLLWTALRRSAETETGQPDPRWRRVVYCYQVLTVAKAQTVLRYWNWSLSTSFSPRNGIDDAEPGSAQSTLSAARRTARLVFGQG